MSHDWRIRYLSRRRPFSIKKPVKVYRNLHRKCYSIMQGGLVVAYATQLCLADVTFVVNEAGRQRVLRTGRKNVHAFAIGRLVHSGMGVDHTAGPRSLPVKVVYNPRVSGSFESADFVPHVSVYGAYFAVLNEHGIQAAYIDTDRSP